MLEYSDNYEQASSVLREVLQLLGKHQIPPDPRAYALLYEYISGRDDVLRREVDAQLQRPGSWTADDSHQLYERFVLDRHTQAIESVQGEVRQLIQEVLERIVQSGSDFASYACSLDAYAQRLRDVGDQQILQNLTGEMLQDTHQASDSTSDLRDSLANTGEEIADLRAELERVKAEALTDPLTQLANRKAFDEKLVQSMDEGSREGHPVSLLLVDIDNFKSFNDSFGHLVGDKVIKFIGQTLRDQIKGRDVAARFGGEEFAIILPRTSPEGAAKLADDIRHTVDRSRLMRPGSHEPIREITVSIGVAARRQGEHPLDLVDRADQALYRAKRSGRNRVVSADAD